VSLIWVTHYKASGKGLDIGSISSVVLYPDKVLDDSGNVGKTLYHREANTNGCQLEQLPRKVKYTILAFDIIVYS